MKADIEKIIKAGCQAPSGSNSQPWRFEVRNNEITIIAEPEKDHPILNYQNRGTWIAHGALIENIAIAANHFGYAVQIKEFPSLRQPNITALITLEKTTPQPSPLYESIHRRSTNRKPYKTESLNQETKNALFSIAKSFPDLNFILIENPDAITTLSKASSVNEIIMLENQKLHNLFTNEIVWTEDEEKIKQSGLYLKTMELQAPQRAALKLFRNWNVMNFFNRFKIARGIATSNAKIYAKTPAIAAITVADDDKAFLSVGRLMERLWLQAVYEGLSVHLMTGVLFLYQGIKNDQKDIYSRKEIDLIKRAYHETQIALGTPPGVISLLMRIGKSAEPTARSSKQAPRINFL